MTNYQLPMTNGCVPSAHYNNIAKRSLHWYLLVIGHWSFILLMVLGASFVSAQNKNESLATPLPLWGDFGIEINNTPGNTPQTNPKMIATVDGNFAVVWEDGRDGYSTIYVQKIDRSGRRLWNEVRLIAKDPELGNQNNPQLIDDGSGGIIVAWQGYYRGEANIFAQRVNAQGGLMWSEHSAVVCAAPAGQFFPQLVPDDTGGAIITWHDYRSGSGEDVYAQRVNSSGQTLWEKDGVPVCVAAGTQWYPKIASDGSGGAVIVWSDGRKSAADNDIFAQRLNGNGQTMWSKDGLAVNTASQNQERPEIIKVADAVVIAWNDFRSGNADIFVQKIGLNGSLLWDADGVPVVVAPYSQQNPGLTSDGKGGAILAWADNREEPTTIYAQRVTTNGRIAWAENGRTVAKSSQEQQSPVVIKLSTADWVVVWENLANGSSSLFAQKINSAGVPIWPDRGIRLADAPNTQERASLALSSDGDLAAVWQDRRNGNYDIFAQKISADGLAAWGELGLVVCDTPGVVIHQNASLISAGQGESIVVFEDARSGYLNIYAQKLGSDGTLLWGKNALPVAKIKANQTNARCVSDGLGGAFVCWEDQRDPNAPMVYAQHLFSSGKKEWAGGSRPLTKISSHQQNPNIIADGSGGAIIFWEDERNPLSYKDIYGQRVSSRGEMLWGGNGLPVCLENGQQTEITLVTDGSGGAVLAWTDYRRGERNPDIYAQRIGLDGRLLWSKEGVLVCGAPDVQKTPTIVRDSEGGTIIAWTDKGGGNYDIYAQRLNQEGKTLWITDGIPINQGGRTQQNPLFCSNQIIIWEDYRLGNWDLFANAISLQGKLVWGEEGTSVVSLPQTQYAPQLVCWPDRGAIIGWEDYRSGKQYEVFLQKINADGKAVWQQNGYAVLTPDGARTPQLLAQPEDSALLLCWEDYTGGGKALYGQKFLIK